MIKTPIAEKKAHIHTHHGIKRVDHYAWLKDKSDNQVIEYLNAENHCCEMAMAETVDLRKQLSEELLSRSRR